MPETAVRNVLVAQVGQKTKQMLGITICFITIRYSCSKFAGLFSKYTAVSLGCYCNYD